MHCPFCQHTDTRVIDSRVSEDGVTIRRRRECEACGERFSTLETIELKLPAIIKSDGRRESFDARKLRLGFDRALQKRPVSEEQIETAVRAAKVLGLGVAGVDLIRSKRGPLVLEVNSSPGLEGIEQATGVDVAGCIIEHVAAAGVSAPKRSRNTDLTDS